MVKMLHTGLLEYTEAARGALAQENYPAALALVLTFPDICSQVEFGPGSKRGKYTEWCTKHVNDLYYPNLLEQSMTEINKEGQRIQRKEKTRYPYFSAETLYILRCEVLHSGTSEVEKDKRSELSHFELSITEKNSIGYADSSGIWTIGSSNEQRRLRVDVRRLCEVLIEVTEIFYYEWPDKGDFDKHSITFTDFRIKG